MSSNVVDAIRAAAEAWPESTALVEGADRVSYRRLLAEVDGMAELLRSAGVEGAPGPVALVCPDGIAYVRASLAILAAGAAVAPIPPENPEEVERAIRAIDPPFVLRSARTEPGGGGAPAIGTELGSHGFHLERRSSTPPPSGYLGLDAAFVRLSSGTTGERKGVVLSHDTVLARTRAANVGLEITRDDRVLWVLPMSFHFVVSILLFLQKGATILIGGRDFPDSLLGADASSGPTVLYASPFHFRLLSARQDVPRAALRTVRLALSTAMRLPVDEARRYREAFGAPLAQAYGIIEVGLPFLNRAEDETKVGSVGPPLPDYEVRIDEPDEDGVGEVCLRGPGLFDAYYAPWCPRDQVLEDGWFRTGDLGSLDAGGFLWLCGRRKAVVNFAGMKVFPEEVEEILVECPGVRDARVFGREHDELGELPCAEVALTADGATDARAIRRHAYRHLAPYKVPKEIRIVSSIDKTASGKTKRWGP